MRAVPADSTFLRAGATHYRIAGGAAVRLTTCAPLGGCAGAVAVDPATLSGRAGGRLSAAPKDGTVLRGLPSKRLWEIVGGKRRETFITVTGIDVDDGAIAALPIEAMPQPGPPPPAPVVFAPIFTSAYKVVSGRTRFTAIGVRDVPTGSTVAITCRGKGCPLKSKRYAAKHGRANALKDFRRARLRAGAVVTVTVTGPTGARRVMSFKTRAKKLPVRSRRCADPGAKLKSC